jgi:hypothetical protein
MANHLKRSTSGHLLRNSRGHLINTCVGFCQPTMYLCTFSGMSACCAVFDADKSLFITAMSQLNQALPVFLNNTVDGIQGTGLFLPANYYDMPPYPNNYPANCSGTVHPDLHLVAVGAGYSGGVFGRTPTTISAGIWSHDILSDGSVFDGSGPYGPSVTLNNINTACDGSEIVHGYGGTCVVKPICTQVTLNGRGIFDGPEDIHHSSAAATGSIALVANGEWHLGKLGQRFDYPYLLGSPHDVEEYDLTWLSVTSATSGTGNATITYSITANTTGYARNSGIICCNFFVRIVQAA